MAKPSKQTKKKSPKKKNGSTLSKNNEQQQSNLLSEAAFAVREAELVARVTTLESLVRELHAELNRIKSEVESPKTNPNSAEATGDVASQNVESSHWNSFKQFMGKRWHALVDVVALIITLYTTYFFASNPKDNLFAGFVTLVLIFFGIIIHTSSKKRNWKFLVSVVALALVVITSFAKYLDESYSDRDFKDAQNIGRKKLDGRLVLAFYYEGPEDDFIEKVSSAALALNHVRKPLNVDFQVELVALNFDKEKAARFSAARRDDLFLWVQRNKFVNTFGESVEDVRVYGEILNPVLLKIVGKKLIFAENAIFRQDEHNEPLAVRIARPVVSLAGILIVSKIYENAHNASHLADQDLAIKDAIQRSEIVFDHLRAMRIRSAEFDLIDPDSVLAGLVKHYKTNQKSPSFRFVAIFEAEVLRVETDRFLVRAQSRAITIPPARVHGRDFVQYQILAIPIVSTDAHRVVELESSTAPAEPARTTKEHIVLLDEALFVASADQFISVVTFDLMVAEFEYRVAQYARQVQEQEGVQPGAYNREIDELNLKVASWKQIMITRHYSSQQRPVDG